ncbi:hypothetical protein AB1N83_009865 [Pleurotus pulmonarius]
MEGCVSVRELGDIAPLSEAREMHIYTKYAVSALYWSRVETIFRRYLWLPHLVVRQAFGCYAIEACSYVFLLDLSPEECIRMA